MREKIESLMDEVAGSIHVPGLEDAFPASGGKKMRSRLMLGLCGVDNEDAVKAACSLELIHAATLIHDDIIDGSGMRRSRPALHEMKGVTTGVMYGDLLFSKAFELLTGIKDQRIWKELVRSVSIIVEGELCEQARRGDVSVDEGQYLDMISKKTGELFSVSCRVGSMLAGVAEEGVKASGGFGMSLGIAYQVLDDCADLMGVRGKDPFRDPSNGIMTLPLIKLLENSPDREEDMARVFAGTGRSGDIYMEGLLSDLVASAALEESLCYAGKRLDEARKRAYGGSFPVFTEAEDMIAQIERKVKDARKELSHIGRRLRGAERPGQVIPRR